VEAIDDLFERVPSIETTEQIEGERLLNTSPPRKQGAAASSMSHRVVAIETDARRMRHRSTGTEFHAVVDGASSKPPPLARGLV
jgi:hypothetical protein